MTQVKTETLANFIKNYNGNFTFLLSLKSRFMEYGSLTSAQWIALEKCYLKSNTPKQVQEPKDVSKLLFVKKYIAFKISEEHNLGDMRSYVWETKQVIRETSKAIQVKAKIADADHTIGICRHCGQALTNEFSQITGMGKTCAKKWNITYINKKEDAQIFKQEMQHKINQVGVLEFWIPKSQIVSEQDLITENGNEEVN